MPDKGFDDVLRDLEDTVFGLEEDQPKEVVSTEKPKKGRRRTLPALVDRETADKILKDFMKERNQRKYDLMGMELIFKPYWFFTYTAELTMKDENDNIVDAEEIGGRIAMDAVNGEVADYLQDLINHEPIDIMDLADEIGEVGGEPKIIEPRISEKRLEGFVKQKISGILRVEKKNVSVAGFELLYSPIYKYWMTFKKRTHRAQIDACGGYPVNYDDIPLKKATWVDVILKDIDLLKDPKKWREFMRKKREAMGKRMSGKPKKPGFGTIETIIVLVLGILFFYGLIERDLMMIFVSIVGAVFLVWYMNARRRGGQPPLASPYPPPQYPPPPQ